MRAHGLILAVGLVIASVGNVRGQGPEYVKANYTKHEFRIPMRDGKRLFTSVYTPKDRSRTYPIMLMRTPYGVGPYGVDTPRNSLGPSDYFGKEGYIFAYQDVRGRWMSEGEFVNMRPHNPDKKGLEIDESSDTFDSIDWLLKHVPNHNGRVGQWGISYPGFYTAAGMIDAHPALKASSPQAPVTDWFAGDDWHHNGAFFLPHAFNFMAHFGHPRPEPTKKSTDRFDHGTPDGYDFFLRMGPLSNADKLFFKGDVAFWNEIMSHGSYDDFWKARDIRRHSRNIKPAVMTVGGWFDAENLFGALELYKRIESSSPGGSNSIVMGPWNHGGWAGGDGSKLGHVVFDSKTAEFYREKIEFPFFEYHLKGKGKLDETEAWMFETGRNEWHKHKIWPPADAKSRTLYLGRNGGLGFDPPNETNSDEFDEFVSDPAKPVPFLSFTSNVMAVEYMLDDQRNASRRTDVLTYQSSVIEENVTIVGPIEVELTVSTTGTDSDWIVKLIDVYPDDMPDPRPNPTNVKLGGFQQLVRGDVMRGKFRNALDKPEPFKPGEPTKVSFKLNDLYHAFRPGHRIMVQIQCSWFPLIDRNPQTFTDIYNAKESDFVKATQRVYRGASRLGVKVLP